VRELVTSTEGKTHCKQWGTDGWQGYGRVLPDEVDHYISKALTQRLERTNGTLRQLSRTLASTTKQICQGLGADASHLTFGHKLLQLDLGTFPFRYYFCSTSRPNLRPLELARYCCLFHTLLRHYHRFPPEIISYCIWLYNSFSLSYRDIEKMMLYRGIFVSYEAIRYWCRKFSQTFANEIRRRRCYCQINWAEDKAATIFLEKQSSSPK
jgi:hypothetical protein